MLRPEILLIYSDHMVLDAIQELLGDDYLLLTASNSDDAISLARQHAEIAVVITGIKLETLDGIQTAQEIRKLRPEASLVFHSGYPFNEVKHRITFDRGSYVYVYKGYSVAQLLRAVSEGVTACRKRIASSTKNRKIGAE